MISGLSVFSECAVVSIDAGPIAEEHAVAEGLCGKRERADLVGCIVTRKRPALFRRRHFEDVIILLCGRWYLRYSLTYRDLEEIMAERGLSIDHVTIWRWVQRYAPILNQRLRRELRRPDRSWRVDETYILLSWPFALTCRPGRDAPSLGPGGLAALHEHERLEAGFRFQTGCAPSRRCRARIRRKDGCQK